MDDDSLSPVFQPPLLTVADASTRRTANRLLSRTQRKSVREVYTRSDLTCGVDHCRRCGSTTNTLLSNTANHYTIPSLGLLSHYVELLEVATEQQWKDVIFLRSLLLNVADKIGSRTYRRLRRISTDSKRRTFVFSDEFHDGVCVPMKQDGEVDADYYCRATLSVADWYASHLSAVIVILAVDSDTFSSRLMIGDVDQSPPGSQSGAVRILRVPQYLSVYYPDSASVLTLYSAITTAKEKIQEESLIINPLSNPLRRNEVFAAHWSSTEVSSGIKNQSVIIGTLQVNQYRPCESVVKGDDGSVVLISGWRSRNRACHNDRVAVVLLPREQWVSAIGTVALGYSTAPKSSSEEGEDDDIGQLDTFLSENHKTEPTGRVVAIVERKWRTCVCTLWLEDTMGGNGDHFTCIPMDRRLPKVRISTRQVSELLHQRLVVGFDNWAVTSRYPSGHIIRVLGPLSSLNTETDALLLEYDVDVGGFPPILRRDLALFEDGWAMPPEEILRRRDLRSSHLIFSIDPEGCCDIDDALSARRLSDGKIELGVHIADVSYFVTQGSRLDLDASKKCTTVYMVDRRIDMLPALLSENLCSLRSDGDRLAVSVLCHINMETGAVESCWLGRSVIRSRYTLSYGQAQAILDGDSDIKGQSLSKDDLTRIRSHLQSLSAVSQLLRKLRSDSGALELNSAEFKFELDSEGQPIAMIPKQEIETHSLVAECMIFANSTVASRIAKNYPTSALLRRHSIPDASRLSRLRELAVDIGVEWVDSTNKSLAESLGRASRHNGENGALLRTLAARAMSEAEYGSNFIDHSHYGLGVLFYTHFTSPIRRFADMVVHRQLLTVLGQAWTATTPPPPTLHSPYDADVVTHLCDQINLKNRMAKRVQKCHSEIYMALYFTLQTETCSEIAVIYDIKMNGLICFIPRLKVKAPVYIQDADGNSLLPVQQVPQLLHHNGRVCFDSDKRQLQVGGVVFRMFDRVKVSVTVRQSRYHHPVIGLRLVDLCQKSRETQPILTDEWDPVQAMANLKLNNESTEKQLNLSSLMDSSIIKLYSQRKLWDDSGDNEKLKDPAKNILSTSFPTISINCHIQSPSSVNHLRSLAVTSPGGI